MGGQANCPGGEVVIESNARWKQCNAWKGLGMVKENSATEGNGKQPVAITDECRRCLRRLIRTTMDAACARLTASRRSAIYDEVERRFRSLARQPLTPAQVANRLHPLIRARCGNPDPFAERKRAEMRSARELAARFAPRDHFRDVMEFAAQGNAIDFFRSPEEVADWIEHPPPFALDHLDLLAAGLNRASATVLWLADNAGEVFFDLYALRWLAARSHRVYYAVKEGPVQNDLCLSDLQRAGLDLGPVEVVTTGGATVGLEWDRTKASFRALYRHSDWIVAKGMGHFETLFGHGDPRVLFLFMAKCEPVARVLGVDLNRFVAVFERPGAGVARQGDLEV